MNLQGNLLNQTEGGTERRYGPSGDQILVVRRPGFVLRSTKSNKEAPAATKLLQDTTITGAIRLVDNPRLGEAQQWPC